MTEKGWGRSMLFLITFIFVCVLWNACMLTCVCMYVCGGQRETSDIFVNHSPSYSLDPRLSNSADLTMLPQRSWLHLQVRGCHTYQHLCGCWGFKLETAIFHKNWTISTVPWTLFTVTTNSVLGGAGNWAQGLYPICNSPRTCTFYNIYKNKYFQVLKTQLAQILPLIN